MKLPELLRDPVIRGLNIILISGVLAYFIAAGIAAVFLS